MTSRRLTLQLRDRGARAADAQAPVGETDQRLEGQQRLKYMRDTEKGTRAEDHRPARVGMRHSPREPRNTEASSTIARYILRHDKHLVHGLHSLN